MKSDFKITHEHLKHLGPCPNGWRDFLEAYPREDYPDGIEYQELLDKCADNGRMDYASWLISNIGATEDVREYTEGVRDANKFIVFAGTLVFRGDVSVKGIAAGEGIAAGLRCDMTDKRYCIVKAKTKPQNLICGKFKEIGNG